MDSTRVRKSIIAIAFMSGLLIIPGLWVTSTLSAMIFISASNLVGFAAGNILAIFQTCAPPGQVGTWMGFGNFTANIGGVLSPLLTGIVISSTGSYLAGFSLGPIALLCGIACFVFIVGKLPRQSTTPKTKVS
jgi:MFS-type transporter involved in bile tolerance (Atg22 family)